TPPGGQHVALTTLLQARHARRAVGAFPAADMTLHRCSAAASALRWPPCGLVPISQPGRTFAESAPSFSLGSGTTDVIHAGSGAAFIRDLPGQAAHPARALSPGARHQRGAVRAAGHRGLRHPGHAGCQSAQVAPGPYHLVLRGLPAAALPARLSLAGCALRRAVQFLLPDPRPAVSTTAAWPALAPHRGGGAQLAARGQPGRGGALRPPAHREPGRALPAPGAWPASRAAAPGTAAHGPALQLLPQSAGAGLPGRSAHPAGAARRAAALAWPP